MAVDGLTFDAQADFRAGAFPGFDEVPPNGAQDIVDGLILEDGGVRRRGGSVFQSSVLGGGEILGLWDGFLIPGRRTLAQDASSVYLLDADDTTAREVVSSVATGVGRWTELSHMLIKPLSTPNQGTFVLVGGAMPFTEVSAGTATVEKGSTSVLGVGTAWEPVPTGAILSISGERPTVVASSPDATHLTLAEPWPYGDATGPYTLRAATTYASPDAATIPSSHPAVLASMYGRLVLGNGNRVSFTAFDQLGDGRVLSQPLNFRGQEDYHLLPQGAVVTGLEPLRDVMLVFTTTGLWGLSGLAYDIVDAAGNQQQRLEAIARDLVLWGESGLATWRGGLVVPAVDELYLFDLGGPSVPVTGGGLRLYRSYVQAGYAPGQAAVYRGHYLLPILDGTDPVDLLVWRLDMSGAPFARWAGHAGRARALTVRSGSATRMPDLFAGVERRVESLRSVFAPDSSQRLDADGSSHELAVTTRAFRAGTVPRTWRRLRARADQEAPVVAGDWAAEVEPGVGGELVALGNPTIREGG